MITHSVSWAIAGGWITRCGCFADTAKRLSEDPTCPECRLWLSGRPDQLIEENSRLRQERNDWMYEAERLKRLVDQYEGRHSDGGACE